MRAEFRFGKNSLCVLTLLANVSFAQINSPIQAGYIVTHSHDTVSGTFKYIKRRDLFRELTFKERGGSYFYSITPVSIDSYYLIENNELFVSKSKFEKQGKAKYNFMRAISVSDLSFFTGLSDTKTQTYWAIKNNRLVDLEKGKTKTVTIAGNTFKVKLKPYLESLKKLTEDCLSDSLPLPSDLGFYQLIKLGREYADCKQNNYTEFPQPTVSYFLGLVVGFSNTPLSFHDSQAVVQPYQYPRLSPFGTYDLTSIDNKTIKSSNFFAGLDILILPGSYRRLSYESQVNVTARSWSDPDSKLNFENIYVDFAPSVKYNFLLTHRTQPFFDGGLNVGISLRSYFTSEEVTRTFVKAAPVGAGPRQPISDTWPDEFPVELPLLLAKEYKPTFFTPFISVGVDHFLDATMIISAGYRYGFGGTITKTLLYESSLGYQSFFIVIKSRQKGKSHSK